MHHYERVKNVPREHHVHRVGDWLPTDHRSHREWLDMVISKVDQNPKNFHPVIKEFKEIIEGDSRIYMLFNSMFDELPAKKPYNKDPSGNSSQVRDYMHMLELFNHLLTTAPHWNTASNKTGMVGLPIQAVLDWPMGTPSGYTAFQDPKVNGIMKKMLDAWGKFLQSEESAKQVLTTNDDGWFSETGKKDLEVVANKAADQNGSFEEHFVCDPSKPHFGYTSWDDFFTRQLREGSRPVASPDDDDVIANACESKPYAIRSDVALRDKFWIKGQPYSVTDLVAQHEYASKFEGGTVYQAFLSALSYH
ncbi:hypothetical protein LTS18_005390, partial [Coniosporium uncinatum]